MTTSNASTSSERSLKGGSGLLLTGTYYGAMILLYVGERIVETESARIALAVVALSGIAAAIFGRLKRARDLGPAARPVERRILLCYLGGVVALLLYLIQADLVAEKLRPSFDEARSGDHFFGAFAALWPVVWVCSMLPLLLIEISYAPMDTKRTVELRRIRRSVASGLVASMTVCIVFAVNFIFNEFNEKVDLSYFKTTRPSESSKKMVGHLSEPMKVVLFFPGANEVQERVQSYFEELAKASPKMTVKVADHALQPKLAKEMSVTRNGVVVLSRKKQNEQITIGTKIERAKRKLRKLDGEFQSTFLKVSRSQKIAYFTVGHEERSQKRRDNIKGSSLRDLRTLLTKLNYRLKDLGVGQGLANEIPKDASVVIVAGPRKEFLPGEVHALKTYLQNGGRALVALDPEAGWDAAPLLGPFGLKYAPVRLANDRYHARVRYSKADRHVVFSIRFSAHPSVKTLSRNAPKAASVFAGAGHLTEIPSTDGFGQQVQFTVHSMPFTWSDDNNNYEFDSSTEKRKVYEIAAAVTSRPKGKGKKKAKKDAEEGMRLLVFGDSDVLSDKYFRHPGNAYLFLDAIKWLGGEERFIGETTSEEDVRITHTRKEDQVWFYLTIFAVPALVLGGGIFYTRRRRRK